MFKIKSIYVNPTGLYSATKVHCNLYRIYKNPKAKDLFIKAQKAETVEERAKLLKEMGEYKLVTESEKKSSKSRFVQFLKGIFTNASY